MQAVIETGYYLRQAKKAGVNETERHSIVDFIADHPQAGMKFLALVVLAKFAPDDKEPVKAADIGLLLSTVALTSLYSCLIFLAKVAREIFLKQSAMN